jgi:hypothetical protein
MPSMWCFFDALCWPGHCKVNNAPGAFGKYRRADSCQARPRDAPSKRAGRWQYSYEEQAMARIHESMNRREEIGSERSPAGTSDLLAPSY